MKSAALETVGRITTALMVLAALAGCAVGPDFEPPVVATPESYRLGVMPVQAEVNLKWWELFDDPVLYGLVSHPPLTAILRDISIIVLALVTIITSIFLAILLFQLQSLIVLLRDEIYPILDSVNQTANTVRGTTNFVSDAVVSPMISAASYVSGVRQGLRVLVGGSRKPASRSPRADRTAPPPEEGPSLSGNNVDQT